LYEARAPLHLKLFSLLYFTHDVENVYLSGFVFGRALSQDANKPLPSSFTPLFLSCRLSPQPIALSRRKVHTYVRGVAMSRGSALSHR